MSVPVWVKNASLHWSEDECLSRDPDRVTLAMEWLARFGVRLKDDPVLEMYDGGDQIWHLHADGRIHVDSYDGGHIWQEWRPNPDCRAPCGGLGCGDETCRGVAG